MLTLHTSVSLRFPNSGKKLFAAIASREMTGWLDIPEDPDHLVPKIKDFAKKREGSFDKIICLGIGGSALGISAIQKALYPFDDRLTVIDNLDSITLNHHLKNLNPKRTLILMISKSGETLETMTQYHIFRKRYAKKDYVQNFIILTDHKKGKLREIAKRDGLMSFPIPPNVGGRFSVLSAVGLLPLALLGGSPENLLNGAKSADKKYAEKLAQKNFDCYQQGITINAMMIYSDHLFPFALWYQQLLAESIGKSQKVGITPLPLRGASDQHSVLQLLQDGPNDKLTIFIGIAKLKQDIKLPASRFQFSGGSSLHHILLTECRATEQALREDNRPTVMIEIPELNEFALGELFMLFEMQVAILGELFGINAFDQPGVEKSKKIMKTLLQ